MTKEEILKLVYDDPWMMAVLRAAQSLQLSDWMIGAGFIRNKVWDYLHGYQQRTPYDDIDLIYFDSQDVSEASEKKFEEILGNKLKVNWSVKNHARMHLINGDKPYASTADGLSHWVETATCTAIKLNDKDQLELIAPHGLDDLVNLIVRPSPKFTRQLNIFYDRISKKGWLAKWPKLIVREK